MVFLSDLYHFSFLTAVDENVTSHPCTWHGIVFNSNHSSKYSVMIFIYISLMINDVKHLIMRLFITLYVLFCEVAIQVFFPFLRLFFFFFFLLSLENFLHILHGHLLPGFLFSPEDVFFQSMAYLFIFLTFKEPTFYIFKNLINLFLIGG